MGPGTFTTDALAGVEGETAKSVMDGSLFSKEIYLYSQIFIPC